MDMGFRQIVCVDMNPIAVPEMYLCPSLDESRLRSKPVRYVKVGEAIGEGLIADGAQFTVAPGQCVLILKGNQILDLCAAPGVYIYERSAPASFLMGKLNSTGRPKTVPVEGTEQVLYFNTEDIGGNGFRCIEKVTFRAEGGEQISLMCSGRYCYRIADPIRFYNYAPAGVDRAKLDAFLLEQFLAVIQPAYDCLASMGVTDSSLSQHTPELMATLRALLYEKWYLVCGVELQRISVTSMCFGPGFQTFGSSTVQADQEELSSDDGLEKAAKEFLKSVLSAFGTAIKSSDTKDTTTSP